MRQSYVYDLYGRMTAVKVWNGSALVSISDADSDGFIDADEYYGNQYTIENPYLFQGRRLDRESGLYYFRHRQYDPVHGRFLSRDPMGYADSYCLYQFANNNPVVYSDPMGLVARADWKDDVDVDDLPPDTVWGNWVKIFDDRNDSWHWADVVWVRARIEWRRGKDFTAGKNDKITYSETVTTGLTKSHTEEIESSIGSSLGIKDVASVNSAIKASMSKTTTISNERSVGIKIEAVMEKPGRLQVYLERIVIEVEKYGYYYYGWKWNLEPDWTEEFSLEILTGGYLLDRDYD